MLKRSQTPADPHAAKAVRRAIDADDDSDAAVLARVAAGDRVAFETLYRRYFPRLHRFLERMTRRPHLVEEALNDTMLVVWRKAASFTAQSQVSTWVFAIAYRKALKAMQRFDEPVADDDDDEESAGGMAQRQSEDHAQSPFPAPDAALLQQQLRAALQVAVARMSVEHRAVIELTYYHGCPYGEIADIMGCPVDTVKTRMFHARRRLRNLIGPRREDLP